MENFSDRLRHARKLRNLTQAELGRASGLSQGAISSYENQTRKTTTGIMELARALSVSPIWLMSGTGPMDERAERALSSPSRPLSAHHVKDGVWPFENVSAEDYWRLTPEQRQIVERTMKALIKAFEATPSDEIR